MKKIFSFSRSTANRIVKKAFPDLYPNYFRMNKIARLGGYTESAKQLGLSLGQPTYPKEWGQIGKKRISEFGNTCPIMGESDRIHVHHIDFDTENNETENLIPLWTPYHRWIHARASVSDFDKSIDQAVFLSVTKAWCA